MIAAMDGGRGPDSVTRAVPRRAGLWFAVALLLFGSAAAQELEFTIPIPESLGKPGQVVFASVERKLYCYLPDSGRLAVIDPESREITGLVPVGRGMGTLTYGRRWQRLYFAGDSGLAVLSTVCDSVVHVRPNWTCSVLRVDPLRDRIYVVASPSRLRVVDALSGDCLDSIDLSGQGWPCVDPLRERIWCQSAGVVDYADRLRLLAEPSPILSAPAFLSPWDGNIYSIAYNRINRYDPVTLEGWLAWSLPNRPYSLRINAAANRFYYFYPWRAGSEIIDVATVHIATGVQHARGGLLRAGRLFFVASGKRVWSFDETYRTYVFNESITSNPTLVDSVVRLVDEPGCDMVSQRTFVSDVGGRRILVYRDELLDSNDVAAALAVGPMAVVDTAAGCALRATIVNFGIHNRDVPVFLRVHMPDSGGVRRASDFADTVMVSLDGYDWGVAAFDIWHPSVEGEYVAEVTVAWPEDVNPANDTARCAIRVVAACRDVELTRIASPRGVVVRGDSLLPAAWVRNLSNGAGTCPVVMCIGSTYVDTQHVTVNGGSRAAVVFKSWLPLDTGKFTARCSAMLAGDTVPANNSVAIPVQVVLPGGVDTSESLPALVSVGDWYPNPARSGAQLRFELPQTVSVRAAVYSSNGRLVRTVTDGVQSAGYHNLAWDGCDDFGRRCGPGVYFCHVRAGPVEKSTRLTLLR